MSKNITIRNLDKKEERPVFHDLDALAGTWTQEDAEEFLKATADFRKAVLPTGPTGRQSTAQG